MVFNFVKTHAQLETAVLLVQVLITFGNSYVSQDWRE